jgi:hypothetical protein
MGDPDTSSIQDRRKVLKYLGLSSAGAALMGAVASSKEKIARGGEEAKLEIENLRKAYDELDRRSKLILRLVLFASGLDVLF